MDEKRRRFEALAMPHLDAANNLARWLTRGGVEADDIVQDAMLRAYRSFDGFRGEAVKPWLLAIVRNCHRSMRWSNESVTPPRRWKKNAESPSRRRRNRRRKPKPFRQGAGRQLDKAIRRLARRIPRSGDSERAGGNVLS